MRGLPVLDGATASPGPKPEKYTVGVILLNSPEPLLIIFLVYLPISKDDWENIIGAI
jgi:hypothetical protein